MDEESNDNTKKSLCLLVNSNSKLSDDIVGLGTLLLREMVFTLSFVRTTGSDESVDSVVHTTGSDEPVAGVVRTTGSDEPVDSVVWLNQSTMSRPAGPVMRNMTIMGGMLSFPDRVR